MIELILDTILPGDAALGMPPASMLDFEAYQLRHRVFDQVDAFVAMIDGVARERFGQPFEQLDASQRLAAINGCKVVDVRLFSSFLTHVMRAYYTDRRVLTQASAGAVPPFPAGNELDTDDWTILEPVYMRGTIWRSTDSL
ncbi:gluconate 2-dehydrogenase subunit 3 family protein [Paraburkholderia strydomiana]|jgi:hypothetical protein|uniref:hypothetical protein n=1 Tax=Paraburkholderia strydomiana TaxID=1245417 RepID=UPI0038BB59F4